jgi:hypothetical protein
MNWFKELNLDHKGVNEDVIKKVARTLSNQGIMFYGQRKEGVKRSRAKRSMVFKIGLASDNRIHNVIKTSAGRNHVFDLLRSGETFHADKQ